MSKSLGVYFMSLIWLLTYMIRQDPLLNKFHFKEKSLIWMCMWLVKFTWKLSKMTHLTAGNIIFWCGLFGVTWIKPVVTDNPWCFYFIFNNFNLPCLWLRKNARERKWWTKGALGGLGWSPIGRWSMRNLKLWMLESLANHSLDLS